MGNSRKNPNSGVEGGVGDIEFSGVLKKEHTEIPEIFKKKSCGISMGLGF